MSGTPRFWGWCYHITRKWKPPPEINGRKVDVPKIVGFALIMGMFATDGRNIWPSASTLAKLANVNERTARRLRQDCISLGLLRETGATRSGIPILEISIPPDEGDHGDDCLCSPACVRRYLAAREPKGGKVIRFRGGQNVSHP